MGNNRNLSIDLIKIIAMLSVVGLHSTCDFINPEKFGMANILYRTFVVAIPLFFMVSGFLLLGRKSINYKYSQRKIINIIRFVGLVVVFYICLRELKHIQSFDFTSFFHSLVFNFTGAFIQKGVFGVFWYFGAMIIIYSLLPILNDLYLNKNKSFVLLLIALFVIDNAVFFANIYVEGKPFEFYIMQPFRIWNWLFYFCLGGYTKTISFKIKKRNVALCTILFFVINILFQELLLPYIGSKYCEYFYSSCLVMAFTLSLFLLITNTTIVHSKIIELLSNLFLPMYTIHLFVIWFVRDHNVLEFGGVICFYLQCSLLSILLSFVIMKVPYIKSIFKI